MKVLHIIKSEPDEVVSKIIDVQKVVHDVKVIDISKGDVSYESLVEEIFNSDRVISW